jgi:uncharacterized protein YndB with AHSA1/START domain
MEERSVVHDTVVVRRTYEASAERVYRAWTDTAELEGWYCRVTRSGPPRC